MKLDSDKVKSLFDSIKDKKITIYEFCCKFGMYLKESSESLNDSLLKKISIKFLGLGLNPDTDEFEVNKALDMFYIWVNANNEGLTFVWM